MKYRVKKKSVLRYPDGTLRGEAGYVIDGAASAERATLRDQADALERCPDRQTPVSPFDPTRLAASASPQAGAAAAPVDEAPAAAPVAKKAAKKKAAKKKATRKKAD